MTLPFSPTRTSDFLKCPLYARLKREWQPRGGLWTPNRLLGTAIGDALSELYRGHSDPLSALHRVIEEGWQPNDTWTREALVKLAQKGFDRAAADVLHQAGDVLLVDEPLPSTARPDLVQRVPGLGLVVTDTKVSLRGGSERLDEYFTSHQLFHYAWEVSEVLQEPVRWCRIHLVTLLPRPDALLHPVEIRPERLALWLKGAERTWARMAAGEDHAQLTGCRDKYGWCDFRDACHVLDLDPDRMESIYERVPPRQI